MTQIELDSIRRRAHTESVMQQKFNYPTPYPYSGVEQATEWVKQVRLELAALKAAQE